MLSARRPARSAARPAAARAARSPATAPRPRAAFRRRRFLVAFVREALPRGTFAGFRRPVLSLAAARPANRSQRWPLPSCAEKARGTETHRRFAGAASARLLSFQNRTPLRRLSQFAPRPARRLIPYTAESTAKEITSSTKAVRLALA